MSQARSAPTELDAVLASNVASFRHERGLSQSQVAAQMDWIGFAWTRSTPAQVETGRRRLRPAELLGLALVLRVRLDDLYRTRRAVVVGVGTWKPGMVDKVLAGEGGAVRLGEWTSPTREKASASWPAQKAALDRRLARWPGLTGGQYDELEREATAKQVVRAARRLRHKTRLYVQPFDVAAAARLLWRRPLNEQLERNLAKAGPVSPQQAGHITRALHAALEVAIEEAVDREERHGFDS